MQIIDRYGHTGWGPFPGATINAKESGSMLHEHAADSKHKIAAAAACLAGVVALEVTCMSLHPVKYSSQRTYAAAAAAADSYQDPSMHGLFVVKPALELLWGYEDKLLHLIGRVAPAALPPTGAMVSNITRK